VAVSSDALLARLHELSQLTGQAPLLLVLNDSQAAYLRAVLAPNEVQGLYVYLTRRHNFAIASPWVLYKAFKEAWLEVLSKSDAIPFLEVWNFAQHFAEDIREILLSVPPHEGEQSFLKEIREIFDQVKSEKDLERLFSIEEQVDWLRFLRLPRAVTSTEIRAIYQNLSLLAERFLHRLWTERPYRAALGEEFFTRVPISEERPVIFWNIISAEPRIQEWIAYQTKYAPWVQAWSWPMKPLWEAVGAPIWPEPSPGAPASVQIPFTLSPDDEPLRRVHIRAFQSTAALLEAAAREIVHSYRAGLRVGLWVGKATLLPILESLLRGYADFSPWRLQPPSLLDTYAGQALLEAFKAGNIPAPSHLKADSDETVIYLYEQFYKSTAKNLRDLEYFLQILRQISQPSSPGSVDSRFYVGDLAQLSGWHYERLFIVAPPQEPLGAWFRPSFVPSVIRRLYYPPSLRAKTAWRLLTLLLYGAEETHIYRLAGEEHEAPLEAYLNLVPTAHSIWNVQLASAPSAQRVSVPESTLPLPAPNAPLGQPKRISPTSLEIFLTCPRRFYLQEIARLKDESVSIAAFRGDWLHQTLMQALTKSRVSHTKAPNPSNIRLSLAQVRHLWQPARLFRILRRVYRHQARKRGFPPLRQNPEMRVWQWLLAKSGERFHRHLLVHLGSSDERDPCYFSPEVWVSLDIAPAYVPTFSGRLDLLVQPSRGPRLAMDYKTGGVASKAKSLGTFLVHWQERLAWAQDTAPPPKHNFLPLNLQAYTYAMNFEPGFTLVIANALVNKDRFSIQLSPDERERVQQMWEASHKVLQTFYEKAETIQTHSDRAPQEKIADLERLFFKTPDERACTYCPYKLLCQRL